MFIRVLEDKEKEPSGPETLRIPEDRKEISSPKHRKSQLQIQTEKES